MMKMQLVAAVVLLLVAQVAAQDTVGTRQNLIGTWQLVSAKITTDKGEVRDAWGANPVGYLTYTADGRMSAMLSFRDRKPLSVSDFISAPEAERAQAFATMAAYAGTFAVNGDKVIHHVEIASVPNDVGNNLERTIASLSAERLILRVTRPYQRGGIMVQSQELVWARIQ